MNSAPSQFLYADSQFCLLILLQQVKGWYILSFKKKNVSVSNLDKNADHSVNRLKQFYNLLLSEIIDSFDLNVHEVVRCVMDDM